MKKLADILQAELEVLGELLLICREEQQALLADDLAAIQRVTASKGEQARRLAALEQERQQALATQGGPGGGPSPDTFTAAGRSRLSGSAGEDNAGGEIENLRQALKQAVRELQEINETNRLLARQSLAYVQKMLALLLPEGAAPGLLDRMV
ncbi:MAG: flagellar protein FlgN [Moorella sp. (in: Bacteria)]|nr:flagellar protein FlgN [Moorella sp. (in: firmicutes)]